MSNGTTPLNNMNSSNTTPSHSPTSATKHPRPHPHQFPAPHPPTARSPTSTPVTLDRLATSPTFQRQGRFLASTLHFPNYPGFFAQGVRITHNQQHDHGEFARIIHNTWQLNKNTHSIVITLLAWGTATKYTSGGEEYAMTLLRDHHGAVFHQKGKCWVIHPDHAIVKGLAWSANATPPDL